MRILVSKPDSLGDQIIVGGLLQRLHQQQPQAQIVWHLRSGLEAIADLLPDTVLFRPDLEADPSREARRLAELGPTRIVVLPYPLHPHELWGPAHAPRIDWWQAFLQALPWDLALAAVVNRTWVADLTVALTQAPRRLGFAPTAARQALVNDAHRGVPDERALFTQTVTVQPDRAEAAHLQDLWAAVWPEFSAEPFPALRLDVAAPPGPLPAGSLICVAPGVGEEARRAWPLDHLLTLAAEWRAQGHALLWIEGPTDAAHFAGFPEELAHERRRFQRSELAALAATLRAARLVVCHDTAYVHLAAALAVPTVAIFGAGQGRRFHPATGRVSVVQSEMACGGCEWHCLFARFECLATLPLDPVRTAVAQALAGAPPAEHRVRLASPLASAPEGESAAIIHRLQQEVLTLNADRFARLQIIHDLLAKASPPAPPPPERLSVIVPMGRPERAAATLRSLAQQTHRPASWEIVLVGRQADTVAAAQADLPVRAVPLERNETPPQTRAFGVAAAQGDWYLFVDDDVELATDFLERWHELAAQPAFCPEASPPVGAVGVRLPGKQGGFFSRLTDLSNFWTQQTLVPDTRDWLYSAALLVRASAYARVGGFDVSLPAAEDVDLTRRLVGAGFVLRYEPTLVAYHDHRRDTLRRMWAYFWRNGYGAQYFYAGFGGSSCFSLRTVFAKTWSDLRMNQRFQRERHGSLGWLTPWIFLNYFIFEFSIEWHYQRYLSENDRFRQRPPHSASDRSYVAAMQLHREGRRVRALARYLLAMGQNLADPVRR